MFAHDERHGGGRHGQEPRHDVERHGGGHDPRPHHHEGHEQQQYARHDRRYHEARYGVRHGRDQQQHQGHEQYARHDRRYHEARYGERARRSGALQWAVAVVFTVLAVAVLLAAVAVLVVVLLLQPRSPYFYVRSARLDALVYDQQGTLDDVQMQVLVEARNGNAHAAAEFAGLEVRLAFAGAVLAKLRADAFAVAPQGALPLAYVARARGAPLDEPASAEMEAAIRAGVVPFRLDGEARTRWKLAGIVEVRHWSRLGCQIDFFWPNGTALDFHCKSKSKSWFF